MMISTRGRYALRVLTDLAEQGADGYIPLKDIAARQEISQKYLESIMSVLSKNALVDGAHGKGGGYRLNRLPEQYTLGEILRLTEGSLTPVGCQGLEQGCERMGECRTFPIWAKLDRMVQEYLDSVTLADVMAEKKEN